MSTSSHFDHYVRLRYQLYNSLFLTLPFDLIHQTGTLLPILTEMCAQRYDEGANPEQIISEFFKEYLPAYNQEQQVDVLFNFIKYIERQVVLFDAVEESAFDLIHDMDGKGTIHDLFHRIKDEDTLQRLMLKLNDFKLRIILTAHPTQFYPGTVLGIITDLAQAIRRNDLASINTLLLQLGKTPFINRQKPTPLDEARSLTWYLEHVFYDAISAVITQIQDRLKQNGRVLQRKDLITMGFWPGGDRDGNPFVTADITIQTAQRLRRAIMTCYHRDVRELRRRLTFQDVQERIVDIEYRLFDSIHEGARAFNDVEELTHSLQEIQHILHKQHDGLFADLLENFMMRVEIFGFYFATLDIRQDSRKHEALIDALIEKFFSIKEQTGYRNASVPEKVTLLANFNKKINADDFEDPISKDIIESMHAMRNIQLFNGVEACHRYVISNTRHALDVMSVLTICRLVTGHPNDVDIVPLFETIDDLRNCGEIMDALYTNAAYVSHLDARNRIQTVMLGFSDGTKDGGYLRANWSIFRAKEMLTEISRKHGIRVLFFDGRGGPPSRGGGNTHKFYSSQGPTIESQEVQLTIQGQTVSSNFGSHHAAVYNIEQLFSAGIESAVFSDHTSRAAGTLAAEDRALMEEMADLSFDAYATLKQRSEFLNYLQEIGTLDYYGGTNIGSRPVKRGQKSALTLDALRAIPFTGSWSQMKQNVPGYYGFGTALHALDKKGLLQKAQTLYKRSMFFQTLVGNSMQSLSKSYFPLTAYLSNDPEYGDFWNDLYREYTLTVDELLKVSGQTALMDDNPDIRQSIQLREKIVIPLLTIQQAALQKIRSGTLTEEQEAVLRKVVLRTMYGIINAGRNVA